MDERSNIPPVRYKLNGRPLNYEPEELLDKFREYVEWAMANPIVKEVTEASTSVNGGKYGRKTTETIPRLVSIGGFLVFIGEGSSWWTNLEKRKRKADFIRVKALIRDFCESYQKEMASANIFNGNIISRLLGLADKQQVDAEVNYRFKFGDEQ